MFYIFFTLIYKMHQDSKNEKFTLRKTFQKKTLFGMIKIPHGKKKNEISFVVVYFKGIFSILFFFCFFLLSIVVNFVEDNKVD